MRRVGCSVAYGVLTVCLGPMAVEGAEFTLRPNVAVEGSFNDNIFLTPDSNNQTSSWRAVVYPGLNLRYRIGAFALDTFASAAINRYIDNASLNTDDQFYRLTSRYDFGRHNLNLNFRYNKIATLRTELADTGDLQGFARQRERIHINPSWQYKFSELLRMTIGYTFLQSSYTDSTTNDTTGAPLTGSKQHGGNINLEYSFTDRLRGGGEFTYSSVTGDTGYAADNYMLRFPLTYDYSETFRTSAHVGARYVDSTNSGGSGSSGGDAGFLVGFALLKKFDIGKIDLSLGRDVSPSGYGTQRQRDQVRLALTANLTETIFAGLVTQFIKNEQLGGDANTSAARDREFFEVSPNLRWQWAENWALNTGYVFRTQKIDTRPGTGYGNMVFLNIGYSFEDVFLPE